LAVVGVDLFAGAGGLSIGAAMAGVRVEMAVECDPHAVATYRRNHTDTEVVAKDIAQVKSVSAGSVRDTRILFGGPPCQGFSCSNRRTRNSENEKNWLFREFARLASSWKPDWILLENVKGLVETEGGIFLEAVLLKLEELGYTTSWWVLDASEFGVPQRRNRLFIIGSKDGVVIPKPQGTHHAVITVNQAITDLPSLDNGSEYDFLPYRAVRPSAYANSMRGDLKGCGNHYVTRNAPQVLRRYQHVPQGGNWEDIPAKLMRNYKDRERCHTGIYHRLYPHDCSVVIGNYRKNMLIHPVQDRGLSVREAARLQSFPDDYVFQGSIGFQQQQVGNAVPPLLAKAVFAAILDAAGQ